MVLLLYCKDCRSVSDCKALDRPRLHDASQLRRDSQHSCLILSRVAGVPLELCRTSELIAASVFNDAASVISYAYQKSARKSYTNLKKLGSGAFGSVYKAQCRLTAEWRAIKRLGHDLAAFAFLAAGVGLVQAEVQTLPTRLCFSLALSVHGLLSCRRVQQTRKLPLSDVASWLHRLVNIATFQSRSFSCSVQT